MTYNLKIGIIFSLFIHTFLLFGLGIFFQQKTRIITIPVDFVYYRPPATAPRQEPAKLIEKTVLKTRAVKKISRPDVVSPTPAKEMETPATEQPLASSSLNVEAVRFPYTYYLNQIRKRIAENWMWSSTTSGNFRTVIYFRIQRDGQISEPVWKERSGSPIFDNLALRAVKISAPFPPLPDGYPEDNLGIYFEFNYR